MLPDAFSGSVPENYDRYLGPVLFEPYARELAARIPHREGLRVLELACGTGIATRRLREALPPSATLTATDLSAAMIGYASRAVTAPGITWLAADAQSLPFADGAFDCVVCQFGMMFLPSKVRGFAEARRVLAPGGQLIATVWRSLAANPFAAAMARVLADVVRGEPPKIVDVIHGYDDPERISADLREAGWEHVALEPVLLEGRGPAAADLARGFAYGSPMAQVLAQHAVDPQDFVAALTPRLVELGGDAPFSPALAALVITATR